MLPFKEECFLYIPGGLTDDSTEALVNVVLLIPSFCRSTSFLDDANMMIRSFWISYLWLWVGFPDFDLVCL